jgi:hypothetical protein
MVDKSIGIAFVGLVMLLVAIGCIPIFIINIASAIVLGMHYDASSVAIWLLVNTIYSFVICVGVCGLTGIACAKNLNDVENMMFSVILLPIITFFIKIAFNVWGAIVLFTHLDTTSSLCKMSLSVLIIQWTVYIMIGIVICIGHIQGSHLRPTS